MNIKKDERFINTLTQDIVRVVNVEYSPFGKDFTITLDDEKKWDTKTFLNFHKKISKPYV